MRTSCLSPQFTASAKFVDDSGKELLSVVVLNKVLDAYLEEEVSKSKMRSLASLFHGTTDAPFQDNCKRHKVDSRGPAPAKKVTSSPAIFRFNFADG